MMNHTLKNNVIQLKCGRTLIYVNNIIQYEKQILQHKVF